VRTFIFVALAVLSTVVFAPTAQAATPWYLDSTWCEPADDECVAAQQAKALAVRSERVSSFASEQMDEDGFCWSPSQYVEEYLGRYQDRLDDEGDQALRAEALESRAACAALETEQQRIDRERERRHAARDRRLHRRDCAPVRTTVNRYAASVEVSVRYGSCEAARRLARATLADEGRRGRIDGWRRTYLFDDGADDIGKWLDSCADPNRICPSTSQPSQEWEYRAKWRKGRQRVSFWLTGESPMTAGEA
jgi:hypothetical protein